MIDFNEYQKQTSEFRLPTYIPEACVMGLLAECGEVAAVFQKMMRGDYNADQAATKLHAELGDVLWHIGEIANDNGWTLSEIAQANLDKLASRKLRGVILGSGDHR
jgi:NTP pyrophosphatase (non-canonical NTP hydrolase)